MVRLALLLHLFIGATLSGSAVIAVLVAGMSSGLMILGAAALGFLLAFPISFLLARRLYRG
ncbi:CTP synthetase [Arenibacterium sp. LLYu02]|uniref:CTP synthetase n=1 Tax=Arenibacterium sp. LLYu02 TaxID=3404132 RepID=UPI003B226A70